METVKTTASAAGEEVKPMFTMVKDGNGFEVKVANLDHPEWAPFNGIVQVEATRVNKHGAKSHYVKNVRDSKLGCIFGVALGVNQVDKTIRWQGFDLKELNYFNLAVPQERRAWIILSRASYMENSPNQSGPPRYRVIDHEKKAENYLQQYSERKRATEIYENMTFSQMLDIAPGFGINVNAHSEKALRAEIAKIAIERHADFLSVWDDPNRPGMLCFKKASKLGMITFDISKGGFIYEGIVLGSTEASAHAKLTNSVQLLQTLEVLVKEKESVSEYAVKISPKAKVEKDEYQSVIESQSKEIEELKKRLADKESRPDVVHPENPEEKKLLIEEAKALGIRGAHLCSIDILKEKISEAKLNKEKTE